MEFLDTNILVYAHDDSTPDKAGAAAELVLSLAEREHGVLSTQVLGEFFQVVTRKIEHPLSPGDAREAMRRYEVLHIMRIDVPMIHTATELVERYQIGYYDALIIAAAARAGCETLHSEDLNHGQEYQGVTVRNPFA